MNTYRAVSVDDAKALADAHGLNQIVIWHFRKGKGMHVTTWGDPWEQSALAAEAGNHVKKAAGFPAEACQALPGSIATLFALTDAKLAAEIRAGTIEKGAALATLLVLRDAVRDRDPELAESLIAHACEDAKTKGDA